jgi:hypothetical protein
MGAISENSHEAIQVQKKGKDEKEKQPKFTGLVRVRLIPIWLRFVIVILLLVLSITIGAAVGYGVLGNGSVTDIFHKSTWTHIIDLVEKE